jgi:hypothetical protein
VDDAVRPVRLLLAALLGIVAVVLALGAHDLLAWRSAFAHGDATLTAHPARAHWSPATLLPRDPISSLFALGDDVQLRGAVRSFDIAIATGRGFDAGETQDRVRSAAEARLSDVTAEKSARQSSQAGDLLGVLVAAGGAVTGGLTADDRAQDAFDAAVRRDPSNTDAKYNLELLLRRTRATSTRHGPGNGAGTQGRGRRGAGAGTPGRGY